MYKIQLFPLAKDDLLSQKKYSAYEFNENITNEMIKKVTVSFGNLEEYPLLERPLKNLINIPTEYKVRFYTILVQSLVDLPLSAT